MGIKLWTVDSEFHASFSEKGSTFLGFLLPISQFESRLKELKDEHPKAVHFVSASRFLNKFSQTEESFSDDGEPKGTSGMPTLKVLRGYGLINIALISVRYFGGTLLGTGGLVRAYTESAKGAILGAKLTPYRPSLSENIELAYHELGRAEYLANKLGLILQKHDFMASFVACEVSGEESSIKEFLRAFKGL
ncbi:MAG: YigZ family protein [Wolinella sp.]